MIKINELRFGNYVNDPVDSKDKRTNIYQIAKHQIDDVYTNYSAIPLTPEILEKAGFRKYSHEPGYTLGEDFEKSEKCDEYSFGKITIMDWGNGFVLSNSFSFTLRVEIKYLHQLQNLYFALTGEELNVQL